MPLQMPWHRDTTTLVLTIAGSEAGEGMPFVWQFKALAQLCDLHIHHAKDGKVVKAERALLPGDAIPKRSTECTAPVGALSSTSHVQHQG